MPNARDPRLDVMSRVKARNDQTVLNVPQIAKLRSAVYSAQTANVKAQSLGEFSSDLGDVGRGNVQIRADGSANVIRLNYITFFSTDVTPTVLIPPGSVTGDNLLKINLTGHLFQNTGVSQTLTPKVYLGVSGSETLITSDTALSMGSGQRRNFNYSLTVSHAPCLGNYVICNEEFILESATAGTPIIISRVTQTLIIDVENLNQVNSLFIRIANGATATMFRVFSDTLTVQIVDGVGTDQIHWWDQPIGVDGCDTEIIDTIPATNRGSLSTFGVGEFAGAVQVTRGLIKFSKISNIPTNAQILSVTLHLTISSDNSGNIRTLEAYRVLRNWTEAGATWNTYNGVNAWGTVGCGNNTTDYDGSVVWGSLSFSASETVGTVKGISLNTSEFKKWLDGTYQNYGLLLKMQTETNDQYDFQSAQSATPDLAPILEVVYTVPN